eukprot:12624925-Alexandrium_andersonii.AAC.1
MRSGTSRGSEDARKRRPSDPFWDQASVSCARFASMPSSSSMSSVFSSGIASMPTSDSWSLAFTACASDAAGPPPVNSNSGRLSDSSGPCRASLEEAAPVPAAGRSTGAGAASTSACSLCARCSLMRSSARAMLASPRDRSSASNLVLRSSERRAPTAGRRSRTRVHFKHPAVYPCSSSIACVMFTRLGACAARGRGSGAASWAT